MKVLRAFQVINRDGMFNLTSTYNEVDEHGDITKINEKDSFIAVDTALQAHIDAIEEYIRENRLTE